MEIVTETETETESALGVMQGDIWSRCLTDAASKRRGGQSLGRETTGGKWRSCRRTADTPRREMWRHRLSDIAESRAGGD